MLVKCNAKTCRHNESDMCQADAIEMVDFEYYEDAEGKRREISKDEMKCSSYKSKYEIRRKK